MRYWPRMLVLLGAGATVLGAWHSELQAQTPDEAAIREQDSQRFLEMLENAPPAEPRGGRMFPAAISDTMERRSLLRFDQESGATTLVQPSGGLGIRSLAADPREPAPVWNVLEGRYEMPSPALSPEGRGNSGFGAASCTPPSPLLATHTFPWTTKYKLVMRFNVGGVDFFSSCSASSMGSFHLLTAGHCIYSRDPNRDGNTSDRKFADEVWAWAAQTDNVNPFMGDPNAADRPYGFAKSVRLTTYVGWADSGDFNHDMGYITLDRRDGDHTGWLGREANVTTSNLNFNGYPAEQPYVPAGELRQYPGFDANNVTSYTTFRINMCAYTYGGHSGGPVWRFDGSGRFAQGVNSTSNRMGGAAATRITSGKFNDIADLIAQDEIDRPPIARPDLAEYFFTTVDNRKDLLTNTVEAGDPIDVEYSVLNAGFAATGSITVDFYLSTNNIISSFDTHIGSVGHSSLAAFTFLNPTTQLTIPESVTPGTYFVGWIMSGSVAEYGGDLVCANDPCTNVAVIADETLTVEEPSCTPDGWEPDDSSAQANAIGSGAPQLHNICPAGEEDWVTFSLAAPSEVVLETSDESAPGDDTRMWLYDAGLSQIEFNDDGGAGLFSRIDRVCGVDELPAGTYFVQIDEFGDDEEIPGYNLAYTLVQSCAVACPDDLVLENDTLGGSQSFVADVSVTMGPDLIVDGVLIQVIAGDRVVMRDGTTIGGVFEAHNQANPCP